MPRAKTYLTDRNLSLAEKWRRFTKKKKISEFQLNSYGPVFYFFTIGFGTLWGSTFVLPDVYGNGFEDWLLSIRILLLFLSGQVAIHWCMLRWVDSEYKPAIHGSKPPDFPGTVGNTDKSSLSVASGAPSCGDSSLQTEGRKVSHRNGGQRLKGSGANSSSSSAKTSSSSTKEAGGLNQRAPNSARPGPHDGLSFTMHVATALPTQDGKVERKPFPYWSWVPCLMCQRLRPPRCHHCTLCRKCVLKRDHHCYFSGRCVGVNNQRYFITFLFWAFLLTSFGTYHFYHYITGYLMPKGDITFLDLLFPLTIFRALLGYCSIWTIPKVMVMLSVLFCNWFSLVTMTGAVNLLCRGKTSFEHVNNIKVINTHGLAGRLRSVMGRHWWLNFLVPTHRWFPSEEDALLWPHIRPC